VSAPPADGAADPVLGALAEAALALVPDGACVGLGTGRAAGAFVTRLGARVRAGLRVAGVPSSEATARQAHAAGIPLVALDEERRLDLTVDGADEVTPELDLLKGRGGALARERILAAASVRQVILVGPGKEVPGLGTTGPLPVEILSFARGPVVRALRALGLEPALRRTPDGAAFYTDNGGLVLDCRVAAPLRDHAAARALDAGIRAVPGVVDTGLFLGTAERVLVGHGDGRVDVRTRGRGA
jgi:ribose 5-phosphate isomerase A